MWPQENPKLPFPYVRNVSYYSHSARWAVVIVYFPHGRFKAFVLVKVAHMWSSLIQRIA